MEIASSNGFRYFLLFLYLQVTKSDIDYLIISAYLMQQGLFVRELVNFSL